MKKVEFGTWSDDCSYIEVDGKSIARSESSDKIVTIGDIKVIFTFDGSKAHFEMHVPDDAVIELEEIEEDEEE